MSRSLLIPAAPVQEVIADPCIRTVTVTGSGATGRKGALSTAAVLKKTARELGGADAFVDLNDADREPAAAVSVASRYLNCGQNCIAAQRAMGV